MLGSLENDVRSSDAKNYCLFNLAGPIVGGFKHVGCYHGYNLAHCGPCSEACTAERQDVLERLLSWGSCIFDNGNVVAGGARVSPWSRHSRLAESRRAPFATSSASLNAARVFAVHRRHESLQVMTAVGQTSLRNDACRLHKASG